MPAFLRAFNIVPGAVYALIIAGMLVHGALLERSRGKAVMEVAQVTATLSTERAAAATAALLANAKYRKQEQEAATKAQEIDRALSDAKGARARVRELERAGHGRVRDDIGAFLTAGRGAAQTCAADLAAERRKSATLGDLLETADRLAGDLADAAERHADEARALKAQLEADRRPGEQK